VLAVDDGEANCAYSSQQPRRQPRQIRDEQHANEQKDVHGHHCARDVKGVKGSGAISRHVRKVLYSVDYAKIAPDPLIPAAATGGRNDYVVLPIDVPHHSHHQQLERHGARVLERFRLIQLNRHRVTGLDLGGLRANRN